MAGQAKQPSVRALASRYLLNPLTVSRALQALDEDGLLAGRHRVEPEYLGPATAYEGDAAREALGPGADPRAFLFTRPFLSSVVRVDLRDPADPHPYWLVSTLAGLMSRCSSPARWAASTALAS